MSRDAKGDTINTTHITAPPEPPEVLRVREAERILAEHDAGAVGSLRARGLLSALGFHATVAEEMLKSTAVRAKDFRSESALLKARSYAANVMGMPVDEVMGLPTVELKAKVEAHQRGPVAGPVQARAGWQEVRKEGSATSTLERPWKGLTPKQIEREGWTRIPDGNSWVRTLTPQEVRERELGIDSLRDFLLQEGAADTNALKAMSAEGVRALAARHFGADALADGIMRKWLETQDVAQSLVDLLNSALEADPEAVSELFWHRVNVNNALAQTPHIPFCEKDNRHTLSALDILNGLLNKLGGPRGQRVRAVAPDDSPAALLRFELADPAQHTTEPGADSHTFAMPVTRCAEPGCSILKPEKATRLEWRCLAHRDEKSPEA